MIPMLVEPNGVGVLADVFLGIHAVDGRRTADADLLAVHEDGHELLLPPLLLSAPGGRQFLLGFGHVR
jgi:hypothetical protein